MGSAFSTSYFAPIEGFVGGGLIGLSAAILLLFSGEILGHSGITASIVLEPWEHLKDPKLAWKYVFLSTFLIFSNVALGKHFTNDTRLGSDPSIPVVSLWGYAIGGLLNGFGTRLGNGCTSGHGICGMARLSLRSISAVGTFMCSAFATAAIVSPDNQTFAKATEFLRTDQVPDLFNQWLGLACSLVFVIPTVYAIYNLLQHEQDRRSSLKILESTEFRNSLSKSITLSRHAIDYLERGEKSAELSVATGASSSNKNASSDHSAGDEEQPQATRAQATSKQDLQAGSQHQVEYNTFRKQDGAKPAETTDTEDQDFPFEKPTNENEFLQLVQEYRKKVADGKLGPAALAAMLFSLGLAISGMMLPSKVLGFLALYTFQHGTYDPTLVVVMIGGSIVSFLSYQFVEGWGIIPNPFARGAPLVSSEFCVPNNKTIDWKLILGSFFFGVGWAVAGLCPGPASFLAATGTKPVLALWWPCFYFGAFVANEIKKRT